jgi:hypothetical protein
LRAADLLGTNGADESIQVWRQFIFEASRVVEHERSDRELLLGGCRPRIVNLRRAKLLHQPIAIGLRLLEDLAPCRFLSRGKRLVQEKVGALDHEGN